MKLSNNLDAINALLASLGIDLDDADINATLLGNDPVIRSVHKLGTAGAVTQLLMDILAGRIWQEHHHAQLNFTIGIQAALHSIHETQYIRQNGYPIDVGAENVAVNNLFECADGRYVMLEAGPPYEKLLNGYLKFFNCPNDQSALAACVRQYQSETLEQQLNALGLPCCRAFTRAEWLATPQGQLLASQPVIDVQKIAAGQPVPFEPATTPLANLRVFDFTHVLAGPYATRSLAKYGADVLHVSSPYHADTLAQHLGVDSGKHNAYFNLDLAHDQQVGRQLRADAHVLVRSHRHRGNEKFNLFANP